MMVMIVLLEMFIKKNINIKKSLHQLTNNK